MRGTIAEKLGQCKLFEGLPANEIATAMDRRTHHVHRYASGETILFRGDDYTELYCLLEGVVDAEINTFDGRTMLVESLYAPQILASAMFFAPEPIIPVDVKAQTDVEICTLSRESVLSLCREYEGFLVALLEDMGARAEFLAEKMRMSQFTSIKQKLAVYLVEQLERRRKSGAPPADSSMKAGRSMSLPQRHTRKELAERFGVARPSLSRVFSELIAEGVIAMRDHRIEVLDYEGLCRLAVQSE